MLPAQKSPAQKSPIMEFRNVGFAHGARAIFDDLCFSVQPGETVALIGPNGIGKTTLLRLAAGLLRPSAGEILVRGRDVSDWGRRQLSCCVALVPQHLEVPFAFRVEEIVAQGRVPHLGFFGGLGAKDHDAVESAMEAVDIAGMRNRIFSELSGGERQRVKIAIGLAQQPRLMLLDEPTQHLDLGRQLELMALLRRLVERGITIVAAVHDLALVRDNCSSAILLTPDAPAMAGPVAELLRADLLERAFSVERIGLERYLATHSAAHSAPQSTAPQPAAEPAAGGDAPNVHEHSRPGEQPRCRGTARLSRNWRQWKP
jgi:iron complex transport system ATP-binding protein